MRFLKYLLPIIFITSVFAQGVHRFSQVLTRGSGVSANVVPYATIKVCVTATGCVTLAPIFSDLALTQPLANPITADSSGNFSYYFSAGCVDEQYSSPSMGNLTRKNVCLNVGGGGGGGSPGGVPFNTQFQLNSTTFGGSKATLDANGDFVPLSMGGTPQPFLAQTSTGSNNGIENSLQTIGNFAEVNQGYANVEYPVTNGTTSFRTPFGSGGFGPPPTIANNTGWIDFRPGSQGMEFYNPHTNTPQWFTQFLSNTITQASGGGDSILPQQTDWLLYCCGKNQELGGSGGNQTNFDFLTYNMFDMTQGISNLLNLQGFKLGFGDYQMMNVNMILQGGSVTPSDEGQTLYRAAITQQNFPSVGNVTSTLTKGATYIPNVGISNSETGEGQGFIIPTQASGTCHVLTVTNPGVDFGSVTVDCTRTQDTIGRFKNSINTPQLYKGATTSEVINLTSLTAAITTSPRSTMCVSNGTNTESALITSVGTPSGSSPNITQTVTVNLRLAYGIGGVPGMVAQGSNACTGMEVLANEAENTGGSPPTQCGGAPGTSRCPIRQMDRIVGCSSTSSCFFAIPLASGIATVNNGGFQTQTIPAGTITRSSNISTINITGGMPNFSLSNDTVKVTGCSDSSFNGIFPNVTQTVISPGVSAVSWANTGSNGSTTCTNNVTLVGPNGFELNAVLFMPMASVVQANNPTTGQADLTYVIEANDYQVLSTDQIETQPSGQQVVSAYHMLMDLSTPSSASAPDVMFDLGEVGTLPDGFDIFRIAIQPLTTDLIGGGGGRLASSTLFSLLDPGIYQNWINGSGLTNGGTAFTFAGCGVYSCTDTTYNGYNFIRASGGGTGSVFQSDWDPPINRYQETVAAAGIGTSQLQQFGNEYLTRANDTASSSNSSAAVGPTTVVLTEDTHIGSPSGPRAIETLTLNGNSLSSVVNDNGAVTTLTQTGTNFTLTGGPTALDAVSVGGSQNLTGVQGTAGTAIAAASGTFTNGNLRSTNATGDEVDSGITTAHINALPTVGTPIVGQAACVKAAGPPVVIGFCSTVVSSSGACTCN